MSYTTKDYKSAAEIKRDLAAGVKITCYQPGYGHDLSNHTGVVSLEGPHYPKPHRWYAAGRMENGVLVSII